MVANTKKTKRFVTWDYISQSTSDIASATSYCIDVVVGLERGGLVPAVMYSHLARVPMVSVRKDELSKIAELAKTKKVLVLDDIVDTGATFREISESLDIAAHGNVVFAALMRDPKCVFETTVNSAPLITVSSTQGDWIVFPWEQEDSD